MTAADLIANYSPVGDVISLVCCVVLLFVIERALRLIKDNKFIYLESALHFIFLGACANLGFYVVAGSVNPSKVLLFILRDAYHISFMFCLYCFIIYMKKMLDIKGTVINAFTYVSRIFFAVCLVMDVLSPFTKVGLHLENEHWSDTMISFYNLFYAYSVLLLLWMVLFNAKRLIKSVRNCLTITWLMVVAIMAYQAFLNVNSYTSFTYILPMLVVMILLHSKPFDDRTGALSLSSFEAFVKENASKGATADYVAIKFNSNMYDYMPKELGKILNTFWIDSFKEVILFDLTSDLFVLAVPQNKKNGNTREKIEYLIKNLFYKCYEKYKLSYKMVGLFDIDFIESADDISGILKYLLRDMDDNTILLIDDKKKEELRQFKEIRAQLDDIEKKNDLDDPRILAFCQPIRNMKTGEFDTAEALMRMEIPGIGKVMPGMFIPIAEDYNYIHTLTRIMLNKVCKEIRKMEDEGYRFKRISVNFVASEIKAENFCDEVFSMIRDNGIDPSKIGIELTESQSESDFLIVNGKIKTMRDAGMTVYLDDIGTGYSNLDRIVRYDVDVVKFDRFFLLEAEKSMKIVKMLTQLSQAFSDLGYKLLYEGVETEEHEALCMNCDADYIQGFMYAKPVPIDKLRDYFVNGDDAAADSALNPVNTISEADGTTDFTMEEMKDHLNVLLTVSKLFYSMHIIDLIHNTARPYNPTEDVRINEMVNNSSAIGADMMMYQIMVMCTEDEYVDGILEFTDLTTIADRMQGKKLLQSEEFIGKSIGWYVATFYAIETDDTGRPIKVLFTTRSDDERKRADKLGSYKED